MINSSTSAIYNRFTYILVVLLGLSLLAGCGGSGSDKDEEIQADPTGYYTGSADVKDAGNDDLRIDDLQAMVSGTRFMALSVANTLLYDGTITRINNNDYSADVTVYKDWEAVSTTTVSGQITEGSQISGTFAGTEAFNGTFTLVYELSNSETSELSRVENAENEYWIGHIGPTNEEQFFSIDQAGVIEHFNSTDAGPFAYCNITSGSSITPIENSRLYAVEISLEFCDLDLNDSPPVYSGMATTRSDIGTDDILVFIYANGSVAAYAEYTRSIFISQ